MQNKSISLFMLILIVAFSFVLSCCDINKKENCCSELGGITLDITSLPDGVPLTTFTIGNVEGVRIYNDVRRHGNLLWCGGSEEVPAGSGNWQDATFRLYFCRLSCKVCKLIVEVHGNGPEARLVATHRDGTTQTAVTTEHEIFELTAAPDNPFSFATFSGQEAEWQNIKLE